MMARPPMGVASGCRGRALIFHWCRRLALSYGDTLRLTTEAPHAARSLPSTGRCLTWKVRTTAGSNWKVARNAFGCMATARPPAALTPMPKATAQKTETRAISTLDRPHAGIDPIADRGSR